MREYNGAGGFNYAVAIRKDYTRATATERRKEKKKNASFVRDAGLTDTR